MKKIAKLDTWDLPDTKRIPNGYDETSIPEATPKNMLIFMNKINELTDKVNKLSKKKK